MFGSLLLILRGTKFFNRILTEKNLGLFSLERLPNSLTLEESEELQMLANRFGIEIVVIGSRACGRGRQIQNMDLPVIDLRKPIFANKGLRSDIDILLDGGLSYPRDFILGLYKVGNRAVQLHPPMLDAEVRMNPITSETEFYIPHGKACTTIEKSEQVIRFTPHERPRIIRARFLFL